MNQNVVAVLAEVSEQVKNSNSAVRKRVVDALVEKEVSSRAKLLDESLAKALEIDRALKKLKPAVLYSADGQELPGTFTKKELDEKRKTEEKLHKLESAIAAALEGDKDQWNKLKEALQKAGQSGGGSEQAAE